MVISSSDTKLAVNAQSVAFFVAQTNLQLFSQLRQEGYLDDDLKKIAQVYDFALRLFPGCFQANGKSFIAHSVGTASILASVHAPIEVVAAGLLHEAYIWGNFGTGEYGRDKAKRKQVRTLAGWEVDSYIDNYHDLEWNSLSIATLYQTLDQLHSRDRNVLLIRLANELEDHLDLGILYCNNHQQRLDYLCRSRDVMIAIAKDLGYPTLAAHLAKVFDACLSTQVHPQLCTDNDISHLIPPLSHRRRWRLLVWEMLTKRVRLSKV